MYALKAALAFRAGDHDTGMRWTMGYMEQRTCTRTPALMAFLKTKDYAGAAGLLEFIAGTL